MKLWSNTGFCKTFVFRLDVWGNAETCEEENLSQVKFKVDT